MKYLIVNADDFGVDVYRNQGIAEAVNAGIVTSVSVLANGPAIDDALARLSAWQSRGVSVGLHVNLSEGCPVSKGLYVLPDEHGCFRGKSSTYKLLMVKGNKELEQEVFLEIAAQIGLLKSTGIRISHLDGHQHVHVFPAVIAAAVRAAQRHGIAWLRIPEEPALVHPAIFMQIPHPPLCQGGVRGDLHSSLCPPLGMDVGEEESPLLKREADMFSRLAEAARPFLNGSGVRTTDHFRGLYLKGRLSFPRLERLLTDLPAAGLTELMVHPGRAPAGPGQGPFAAFSSVDREGELDALLDLRLLKILKENGVFLTPFSETGL